MFCENCGNKLEEAHKFCVKCGHSNQKEITQKISSRSNHFDQKWWYRLAKVIYIALYIPLPFLIALVWSLNSSTYNFSTDSYSDTTGESFWYSLLALVIYIVIARLIKITFLYITFAQKPQWKREFKKLF